MPLASRLAARADLEKPGLRESGKSRTSINVCTPVRRSVATKASTPGAFVSNRVEAALHQCCLSSTIPPRSKGWLDNSAGWSDLCLPVWQGRYELRLSTTFADFALTPASGEWREGCEASGTNAGSPALVMPSPLQRARHASRAACRSSRPLTRAGRVATSVCEAMSKPLAFPFGRQRSLGVVGCCPRGPPAIAKPENV